MVGTRGTLPGAALLLELPGRGGVRRGRGLRHDHRRDGLGRRGRRAHLRRGAGLRRPLAAGCFGWVAGFRGPVACGRSFGARSAPPVPRGPVSARLPWPSLRPPELFSRAAADLEAPFPLPRERAARRSAPRCPWLRSPLIALAAGAARLGRRGLDDRPRPSRSPSPAPEPPARVVGVGIRSHDDLARNDAPARERRRRSRPSRPSPSRVRSRPRPRTRRRDGASADAARRRGRFAFSPRLGTTGSATASSCRWRRTSSRYALQPGQWRRWMAQLVAAQRAAAQRRELLADLDAGGLARRAALDQPAACAEHEPLHAPPPRSRAPLRPRHATAPPPRRAAARRAGPRAAPGRRPGARAAPRAAPPAR